MTPHTIFLFDIDGTLISAGGAGRRAVERTFVEHLGVTPPKPNFSFAGMTDRAIVRQVLAEIGLEADEAGIDGFLDAYLEVLPFELARSRSYRTFDGVHALLERLAKAPATALGLGTGNVERGARIKLEPAGLNDYFGFGGFGCMAEARSELLRLGAEEGARRLGQSREACRVVVIGDTPLDVAAGRAIGAECIAVATGHHSLETLRACHPDHLFSDLTDARVWESLVGRTA